MVSQYASYLNNQFRLQQDDLSTGLGQLTDYRTTSSLHQPLPENTLYMDEEYAYAQPPPVNVIASQPVSRAAPQYPTEYASMSNGYSDRFDFMQPPPSIGHVYSRNERNYGARPALAGDYGNFLHNRAQSLHKLDSLQDFVNHNVGYAAPPRNSQYHPTHWSSLSGADQLADASQSLWNRPPYTSHSVDPFPVRAAYDYGRSQYPANRALTTRPLPAYSLNNNASLPYQDDLSRVMQNYGRQSAIRPSSYGAYNPGTYNVAPYFNPDRFMFPDGR